MVLIAVLFHPYYPKISQPKDTPNMPIILTIAAIFGFLAVALGAFGAHALKEALSAYGQTIWEKAVLYQMFHTLAIFLLMALKDSIQPGRLELIGWLFIAGILLFSGSLYLLAFTQKSWLGAITPLGGIAFLAGWGFLIWELARKI